MEIPSKLKFWEKKSSGLSDLKGLDSKNDLGLDDPLKPKDDLGLDDPLKPKDDLGLDTPMPHTKDLGIEGNLDRDPMGSIKKDSDPLVPPIHQPKPIKQQSQNNEAHTELILSKLDAIKANIENLNLRMTKLENQIEKQINKKPW